MLLRHGAMRRTAVLEAVVHNAGVSAVGHWMGRRSPAWSAGSRAGGAVAVVESMGRRHDCARGCGMLHWCARGW